MCCSNVSVFVCLCICARVIGDWCRCCFCFNFRAQNFCCCCCVSLGSSANKKSPVATHCHRSRDVKRQYQPQLLWTGSGGEVEGAGMRGSLPNRPKYRYPRNPQPICQQQPPIHGLFDSSFATSALHANTATATHSMSTRRVHVVCTEVLVACYTYSTSVLQYKSKSHAIAIQCIQDLNVKQKWRAWMHACMHAVSGLTTNE